MHSAEEEEDRRCSYSFDTPLDGSVPVTVSNDPIVWRLRSKSPVQLSTVRRTRYFLRTSRRCHQFCRKVSFTLREKRGVHQCATFRHLHTQRFAADPVIISDFAFLNDAPKYDDVELWEEMLQKKVRRAVWVTFFPDGADTASRTPDELARMMAAVVVTY